METEKLWLEFAMFKKKMLAIVLGTYIMKSEDVDWRWDSTGKVLA
jgi:hypothetical protein